MRSLELELEMGSMEEEEEEREGGSEDGSDEEDPPSLSESGTEEEDETDESEEEEDEDDEGQEDLLWVNEALERATKATKRGQWAKAAEEYKEVVAKKEMFREKGKMATNIMPKIWMNLSLIYLYQKKFDVALKNALLACKNNKISSESTEDGTNLLRDPTVAELKFLSCSLQGWIQYCVGQEDKEEDFVDGLLHICLRGLLLDEKDEVFRHILDQNLKQIQHDPERIKRLKENIGMFQYWKFIDSLDEKVADASEESKGKEKTPTLIQTKRSLQPRDIMARAILCHNESKYLMAAGYFKDLGSSDLYEYCQAMSNFASGNKDKIKAAVDSLKSIVSKKGSSFAPACYGLAKICIQAKLLSEAETHCRHGKMILKESGVKIGAKEEELFTQELKKAFPELDKETLEALFEAGMNEISNHPPPTAVCNYDSCLSIDARDETVGGRREIYQDDPEYKGFYAFTCGEKCNLTFHWACWRQKKEYLPERINSDKDAIGKRCFTPDCKGLISEISVNKENGTSKLITDNEQLNAAKKRQEEKESLEKKEKSAANATGSVAKQVPVGRKIKEEPSSNRGASKEETRAKEKVENVQEKEASLQEDVRDPSFAVAILSRDKEPDDVFTLPAEDEVFKPLGAKPKVKSTPVKISPATVSRINEPFSQKLKHLENARKKLSGEIRPLESYFHLLLRRNDGPLFVDDNPVECEADFKRIQAALKKDGDMWNKFKEQRQAGSGVADLHEANLLNQEVIEELQSKLVQQENFTKLLFDGLRLTQGRLNKMTADAAATREYGEKSLLTELWRSKKLTLKALRGGLVRDGSFMAREQQAVAEIEEILKTCRESDNARDLSEELRTKIPGYGSVPEEISPQETLPTFSLALEFNRGPLSKQSSGDSPTQPPPTLNVVLESLKDQNPNLSEDEICTYILDQRTTGKSLEELLIEGLPSRDLQDSTETESYEAAMMSQLSDVDYLKLYDLRQKHGNLNAAGEEEVLQVLGVQPEKPECIICYEEMREDNAMALSCGHVFHEVCIKQWLRKEKSDCPVCRKFHVLREDYPELGSH